MIEVGVTLRSGRLGRARRVLRNPRLGPTSDGKLPGQRTEGQFNHLFFSTVLRTVAVDEP